eukprot:TRINITY_DN90937_c0_g1_i1.p1 TRINITY_DN90937_c0_g1~~TRINITY_DN90937_c0_g1_i1.p1  ORF type:complete len:739 (-),score=133.91 TRINITY_DN90937_c0_g1_i1:109-2325(-)
MNSMARGQPQSPARTTAGQAYLATSRPAPGTPSATAPVSPHVAAQQQPAASSRQLVSRVQTARGSYAAPAGPVLTNGMANGMGGYPSKANVAGANAGGRMSAAPPGQGGRLSMAQPPGHLPGPPATVLVTGSPGNPLSPRPKSPTKVNVQQHLPSATAASSSSTATAGMSVGNGVEVSGGLGARPRYARSMERRGGAPADDWTQGLPGNSGSAALLLQSAGNGDVHRGLAARAAACVHPNRGGSGARRGSSTSNGPGRLSACERSHSAGVRHPGAGEALQVAGLAPQRSSSALLTLATTADAELASQLLASRALEKAGIEEESGSPHAPPPTAGLTRHDSACAQLGLAASAAAAAMAAAAAEAAARARMATTPRCKGDVLGGAMGAASSSKDEPEAEPTGWGPCGNGSLPRVCLAEDVDADFDSSPSKKLQSANVMLNDDGDLRLNVRINKKELVNWNDLHIVRPVSTGSFGEVFMAIYQGREVSVKRCILGYNGSMTKEQLHNLEREINTYRTLDHPCIVKYIGCVLDHPRLAIVTEYVPNGNVFDLLYTYRRNPPAAARLKIARQVVLAICYMHSCDPIVIHRDLKTQNLVLADDYNVKLCDFGKTQPMDENSALVMQQDNGGSPRYMAPECFRAGGFVTEKVDIWSLGCCLVEIFGGPLPYEDVPQMSQVVTLILRDHQPPLVPPWFAPEVRPMLSRCFDFNPQKRLTISEVQLVLKSLCADDMQRCGMDVRRTC